MNEQMNKRSSDGANDLIPQSEADAMVAAALEAAANLRWHEPTGRATFINASHSTAAKHVIHALISEPAAKALAEREKALLKPKDDHICQLLTTIVQREEQIDKLEADNAALRELMPCGHPKACLVEIPCTDPECKPDCKAEMACKVCRQLASAERRGRLEEAMYWNRKPSWIGSKQWRKQRIAALESAQPPQLTAEAGQAQPGGEMRCPKGGEK